MILKESLALIWLILGQVHARCRLPKIDALFFIGEEEQQDPNFIYASQMVLTVHCKDNAGQLTNNELQIECVANGRWEGLDQNVCATRHCRFPPWERAQFLIDGRVIERDFHVLPSTVVLVRCLGSYTNAKPEITCTDDGSWQGRYNARCYRSCERPPPRLSNGCYAKPSNQDVCLTDGELRKWRFGTSLIVQCLNGASLVGARAVRCSRLGPRNAKSTCEFNRPTYCRPPRKPDNGFLTRQGGDRLLDRDLQALIESDVVVARCEDGYELSGRRRLQCTNSSTGLGFPQPGSCLRTTTPSTTTPRRTTSPACCHSPKVVTNGQYRDIGSGKPIDLSRFMCQHPGYMMEVTCNSSFKLNGPSRVLCDHRLTFTHPGTCERVTTTSSTTTSVETDGTTEIQTSKPIKTPTRTETAGSSEATTDRTTEIPCCDRPKKIANGYYTYSGIGVRVEEKELDCLSPGNTKLIVNCDSKFILIGRKTVICNQTAVFSKPGKCVLIPPPPTTNSTQPTPTVTDSIIDSSGGNLITGNILAIATSVCLSQLAFLTV